jgi:hypothetical protein
MAADLSIRMPGPGAAALEPGQMSPPRRAGDNEAFSFWGVRIPVSGVVRVAEAISRVGVPGICTLGAFVLLSVGAFRYADPLVTASIEKDRAITAAVNRFVEGHPETLKLLQLIHDDSIRTQALTSELLQETRKAGR